MEERRKFPRIRTELFVRYKTLRLPDEHSEAQTKDISEGGVCLIAREQIQAGTVLAMEINFPHLSKPIPASGRVIWSRESNLGPSPAGHPQFDNGIEFEQISEPDRQQIAEFVSSEQDKTKAKGWNIGIVRNISKEEE